MTGSEIGNGLAIVRAQMKGLHALAFVDDLADAEFSISAPGADVGFEFLAAVSDQFDVFLELLKLQVAQAARISHAAHGRDGGERHLAERSR